MGQLSFDSGGADYLVYSHAHNDYMINRPLEDALSNRIYSVEVDIWLKKNKLQVSHNGNRWVGHLEELYLEPLAQRVKKYGSVYGDQVRFFLWIDIKDHNPHIVSVLHRTLKKYEMFSIFTDRKILGAPVTVILTGNSRLKRRYVDQYPRRWAVSDSNHYTESDPIADHRWRYYALDWIKYFKWRGDGSPRPEELKKFREMLKKIHQKGYGVRFYNTPDHARYWKLALEHQVDFINTDKIKELRLFLSGYLR